MKFAAILLLTLAAIVDPVKIGKINAAKREAREAYVAGDYKTAIAKYRYLLDSLHAPEDEVMLNLANSYFNLNDTTQAIASYQSVMGSTKADIRSKAQQQLGVMNHRAGKLEEALNNFKQAIKADPNNRDARMNYEMLKKKIEEEKKKKEQQQQNRDKQNKENQKKDDQQKDQQQKQDQKKSEEQKKKEQEQKDQQQKDQQKKEQEEKEKQKKEEQQKQDAENKDQKDNEEKQEKNDKQPPPDWSKKLQDMKMSEEKARMILEAMKNQEKQYLQQNQRKATKPRDKGKPDW
jgi:Ca-activated chloride channel family protein